MLFLGLQFEAVGFLAKCSRQTADVGTFPQGSHPSLCQLPHQHFQPSLRLSPGKVASDAS